MSSGLTPPTIGVMKTSVLSPNVPWQDAHWASHITWPLETEPEPLGRPLKSGRTSISQALISAGSAGRPTPGYWAPWAMPALSNARLNIVLVNLNIRHIPGIGDFPRLDGVVVIDGLGAAHRAQLIDLRLDVSGLVHRAALQNRRAAVPHPIDAE